MKLFAWQPKGHGELSFFVMAEDETAARAAVEAHIAEGLAANEQDDWPERSIHSGEIQGWGTDYYELTVVEPGVVLTNHNG